jgi:hypothetical protein
MQETRKSINIRLESVGSRRRRDDNIMMDFGGTGGAS